MTVSDRSILSKPAPRVADEAEVTVTDEHERIARDLLINIRGLSFDSQVGTVASLLALALAEERARVEGQMAKQVLARSSMIADRDARIAELEAERDRWTAVSGEMFHDIHAIERILARIEAGDISIEQVQAEVQRYREATS